MRRLSVILFVGALLLFISGSVWAQQQEARGPVPVEFTNFMDRQCIAGGGALNVLDPMQIIYTAPPDPVGPPDPSDVFDFDDLCETNHEIDALANLGDAFFHEVIANMATLLVSFEGDPGVNGVWYENPGGARGILWTHQDLSNVAGGPDPLLEDVDALEVWGPEPGHDANYRSEWQEPWGFAVLHEFGCPPAGGGYVPWADIITAVRSLGWAGDTTEVDLDGLMVWDVDDPETWGTGDIIIFSIRACGNWHGGEIVVLPFGGPASFLNHGGHLWDNNFSPAAAFGVTTDEVDGIEAYELVEPEIPTLTEWGLIVFGVLLLGFITWVFLRRRRAVVCQ